MFFCTFAGMPVSLLEHIISQSFASVKEIEAVAPSEDLQEYIDSFYVFSCCNLSDVLAYNDGTPMLAFLPMAEDSVELEYNNVISSFNSGKIVQPRFARNGMAEFNGITDGIDRFVGSLQIIIYCDTSRFTDRKFGSSCQRCLRAHADR